MPIGTIANGELMGSIRSKLNEVIGLTNLGETIKLSPVTLTGTSVPVTFPVSVSEIIIQVVGFSQNTSGATHVGIVQLGDAEGYEATGYICNAMQLGAGSNTGLGSSAGFLMWTNGLTTSNHSLVMHLTNPTGNLWIANMQGNTDTVSNNPIVAFGTKTLSGDLNSLRFTTPAGTSSFDAGTAYISYRAK